VGIVDGLEEEAALGHAPDAKRVVHGTHLQGKRVWNRTDKT
jgi:hypothetical protein